MGDLVAAILGATAGAALSALALRRHRPTSVPPAPSVGREPSQMPPTPGGVLASVDEWVRLACSLGRRAVGADEVAVWRLNDRMAVREGWAGNPDAEPPPQVPLDGHPFRWIAAEGVHVRLERGRRPLPSPWADVMLLLPLGSTRVVAFSFAQSPPESAEAAAVVVRDLLGGALALRDAYSAARGAEQRLASLLALIDRLAGATSLPAAARLLADTARSALRTDGVALLDWHEHHGSVRFIADDRFDPPLREGTAVEDASRAAWAAKHLQLFALDDRTETKRLPLFAAVERWPMPPATAMLAPLISSDEPVAVLAVWRYEAPPFDAADQEYLRLLCHLGAQAWRTARRFDELDRRASTDPLTGLPNRGAFESRLASLVHHHQRYARPFALVLLDIDHFKQCNDTYGHDAGDGVLRHVGRLLQANIRDVDLAARIGGEEFAILMPETRLADALEAAERLRRALEGQGVVWQGQLLPVTASFGVAACPETACAADRLVAAADRALYRAKQAGRNCVRAAASSSVDNDRLRP